VSPATARGGPKGATFTWAERCRWSPLQNASLGLLPFATSRACGSGTPVRTWPHVVAVLSSTRLPGFKGRNFLTTTGSSATSHRFDFLLSCLLRASTAPQTPRTMPGFPSYCAGSPLTITSSITSCRCPRIGRRNFSHARPGRLPNQVRLRYGPSASYHFLQTPPLAGDALVNRILFPVDGARSPHGDGVCPLRWAIDIGRPSRAFPVTPPGIRVRTTAVRIGCATCRPPGREDPAW
jgi:hypothetical protein